MRGRGVGIDGTMYERPTKVSTGRKYGTPQYTQRPHSAELTSRAGALSTTGKKSVEETVTSLIGNCINVFFK